MKSSFYRNNFNYIYIYTLNEKIRNKLQGDNVRNLRSKFATKLAKPTSYKRISYRQIESGI